MKHTVSLAGLLVLALATGQFPLGEAHAQQARTAAPARPGYIGARMEGDPQGVRVRSLVRGAPGEQAGLQAGDVIVTVSGQAFTGSVEAFTELVRGAGDGAVLAVVVVRAGRHLPLNIHLGSRPPEEVVAVGSPAPAVTARVVRGEGSGDLASLRGRVVVIDFFASWCGPCRMLMPGLDRLHRSLSARGLTVLGITDEDPEVAQQMGLELSIQYPLAVDEMALSRYHVRALPTTIVIDRAGVIRRIGSGTSEVELQELETTIRQLLAEPAR